MFQPLVLKKALPHIEKFHPHAPRYGTIESGLGHPEEDTPARLGSKTRESGIYANDKQRRYAGIYLKQAKPHAPYGLQGKYPRPRLSDKGIKTLGEEHVQEATKATDVIEDMAEHGNMTADRGDGSMDADAQMPTIYGLQRPHGKTDSILITGLADRGVEDMGHGEEDGNAGILAAGLMRRDAIRNDQQRAKRAADKKRRKEGGAYDNIFRS